VRTLRAMNVFSMPNGKPVELDNAGLDVRQGLVLVDNDHQLWQ
jgi:hypothetical protein